MHQRTQDRVDVGHATPVEYCRDRRVCHWIAYLPHAIE
ncbi:hypothetical protein I553_1780 [Mycobacterium xenopi 4042]|uniref:Uncharacterized protein n=1 Tax=Mycobacterium xenopi 4042 TaxID=1299334 RepID=X8DIX1_MYCXE|nr:hypothetical protein I553_1780 [Mycobacterium xenopi 4042]